MSSRLDRGVWCAGEGEHDTIILVAVDSRGLWRRVEFAPLAIEDEVRAMLDHYLELVDRPQPTLTIVR